MKKWILLITTIVLLGLVSCGKKDAGKELQGVTVTDSGEVAVTFAVPEGLTVEDVLGCEIGSENTYYVSAVDSTKGRYTHWYKVAKGGILSRCGDIYRYGPEATISDVMGMSAPPSWVMLYSTPEEDELFNAEDAELLKEQYGVELYFDSNAPNSNAKTDGKLYDASEYSFLKVTEFGDGSCHVT